MTASVNICRTPISVPTITGIMAAPRIVHFHGKPAERRVVVRGTRPLLRDIHDALEGALTNPVKLAMGHPGSFVIPGRDFAIGAHTDAVGCS